MRGFNDVDRPGLVLILAVGLLVGWIIVSMFLIAFGPVVLLLASVYLSPIVSRTIDGPLWTNLRVRFVFGD